MAKFFKESSYDPTKVHQTPGYDAGSEYKNNRNIPTSFAIRQLGAEWIQRKPPKGVFKESQVPINQGEHLKTAGFYEDTIKPQIQYGKYLGKHKYYVYKSGRELGVPHMKLLKHDLSKMRPSEWKPYVSFWHGPKGVTGSSSTRTLQTRYGLSDPAVYEKFQITRGKHFARNPHHFHKINKAQEQDFATKLEMIADWYSTNRTIHEQTSNKPFSTFREWYADKRINLKVDPEVIVYIDNYLLNSK